MAGLGTIVCRDCGAIVPRTGYYHLICNPCRAAKREKLDKARNENRRKNKSNTIVCEDCKKTVWKTGHRMYLCSACSESRRKARLKKWIEKNIDHVRASAIERKKRNAVRMEEEYQHWLKHRYPVIRKKEIYEERERKQIDAIRRARAEKRERKKAKKEREYKRRLWKHIISLMEIHKGKHPLVSALRFIGENEIARGGIIVKRFPKSKYREDGWIWKPGYYRVEKPTDGGKMAIAYEPSDSVVRKFYDHWHHRVRYGRREDLPKAVSRRKLARRRKRISKFMQPKYADGFFHAVAMASAVGG